MFNKMADTEQKVKPIVEEEKRKGDEEDAITVPGKRKRSPKKKYLKFSRTELQEETRVEPIDTIPPTEPAAGKSSDMGQLQGRAVIWGSCREEQ